MSVRELVREEEKLCKIWQALDDLGEADEANIEVVYLEGDHLADHRRGTEKCQHPQVSLIIENKDHNKQNSICTT